MLKRTIAGACYVAVLAAFFVLRENVDYKIFHLLTWLFSVLGTFEVARAVNPFAVKGTFVFAIIFGLLVVPIYALFQYILNNINIPAWQAVLLFAFICIVALLIVCIVKKVDKKTIFWSILPFVYPPVTLLAMLCANDLGANAFIALLMSFVVSPCADTFAYLVGSLIGGPKLCPKLSPKKTWSGAIGGTIGGMLGGILVYIIFKPIVNFPVPFVLFMLVGFVGSIVTMAGDLFESFVKRRVGIKDMGKIIPGHGGVMDRIDGTLFLNVLCCIIFSLV